MGKRKRYTDEFRASAVLMLEAAGYPDAEGALSRVAAHLNVPHNTLSKWARGVQNPPPSQLGQEKKADFLEQLQVIKGKVAEQIITRIEDFEPRDLTGLLKIAAEVSELLEGKPTQRVETIEKWLDDLPADEYDDVIAEAERIIRQSGGGNSRRT
jgi:transposase-like protein